MGWYASGYFAIAFSLLERSLSLRVVILVILFKMERLLIEGYASILRPSGGQLWSFLGRTNGFRCK